MLTVQHEATKVTRKTWRKVAMIVLHLKDPEKSCARNCESYMKHPEKSLADSAAQNRKSYEKDLEKSC